MVAEWVLHVRCGVTSSWWMCTGLTDPGTGREEQGGAPLLLLPMPTPPQHPLSDRDATTISATSLSDTGGVTAPPVWRGAGIAEELRGVEIRVSRQCGMRISSCGTCLRYRSSEYRAIAERSSSGVSYLTLGEGTKGVVVRYKDIKTRYGILT